MGRILLQIDVVEILSLAWDHPLVTGCLALLFTPPLFPVLVFFSPLLISTALCAMALISVGQMETTREREIVGWNARVVEGDRLAARMTNARTRNRVPGEESWSDWVQQSGSGWDNPDSAFMDDIKEEGLKAEFGIYDGGIGIKEEDFGEYRTEDFREFERSFSFKTNVTDSSDDPSVEGAPFAAEQDVPFSHEERNVKVPAPESPILPFFLYNLRTAGMGTAAGLGTTSSFNHPGSAQSTAKAAAEPVVREEPAPEPAPFDSFSMFDIQFNHPGVPQSTPKVAAGPGVRGKPPAPEPAPIDSFNMFDIKFNHPGIPQSTAKAAAGPRVREEPTSESAQLGSFSMSEIIDAVERATQDDPQAEHQRSMFEKVRIPTAAAAPRVKLAASPKTKEKKSSTRSPVAPVSLPDDDFPGFATTADMGKDSPKSLLVPGTAATTSAGVTGVPRKRSEEGPRAPNYNAKLRLGNAVIYSASSDSGSKGAGSPRPGSTPRRNSVNADRRGASRQKKPPFY